MRKLLLVFALLVLVGCGSGSGGAGATPFTGTWDGSWTRGADTGAMNMHIGNDGNYSGLIVIAGVATQIQGRVDYLLVGSPAYQQSQGTLAFVPEPSGKHETFANLNVGRDNLNNRVITGNIWQYTDGNPVPTWSPDIFLTRTSATP